MNRGVFLLIILLVSIRSPAQTSNDSEGSRDTVLYNFVFLESKYQDKFAFLGRNYGLNTALGSVNLLYYTHSNFWIGLSGFAFEDSSLPKLTAASFGIYRELSQRTDFHISYSQYFIPDSSVPSSSRTQGYGQATFGLDWGILYSTVQFHTLLNSNSDILVSTYHSRYFQINQKLWKKILVSWEPKFSLTFGSNHFDYPSEGLVIGPGGGVSPPGATTTDEGKTFKLLNWDFVLPIKFESGRFTLETSWRYTVPINTTDNDPSSATSIFAIGLEYYIPVKRHKSIQ